MTPVDNLRMQVKGEKIVVAPGVFSPSVAKLAEKIGFKSLYFSGAGFSNLLALPDLGITTLSEVAKATHDITSQTRIPLIVDADTGFGEALNVARRRGKAVVRILGVEPHLDGVAPGAWRLSFQSPAAGDMDLELD